MGPKGAREGPQMGTYWAPDWAPEGTEEVGDGKVYPDVVTSDSAINGGAWGDGRREPALKPLDGVQAAEVSSHVTTRAYELYV